MPKKMAFPFIFFGIGRVGPVYGLFREIDFTAGVPIADGVVPEG